MPGTAGVLLAAGAGSRFGGPDHKLLTVVHGRPLVQHALENMARSRLTPLLVVTGAVDLAAVVPGDMATVVNESWADGLASSLAVATRWAIDHDLDAIVVGLGDQPGITPDAWRAVAAATATPVAVATYGGRRRHPVRLARRVWDQLPTTGDQGARVVMAGSPALVTEVACEGDPTDVDTLEDLNRWR